MSMSLDSRVLFSDSNNGHNVKSSILASKSHQLGQVSTRRACKGPLGSYDEESAPSLVLNGIMFNDSN